LYFIEHFLQERLEDDIDPTMLREIQRLVLQYNERRGLAEYRLDTWLQEQWPDWHREEEDTPEEFAGTLPCPECRQDWLVIEDMERPFCFWCNTSVDAVDCEDCGVVYVRSEGHSCY
jgi:hypothetical protein